MTRRPRETVMIGGGGLGLATIRAWVTALAGPDSDPSWPGPPGLRPGRRVTVALARVATLAATVVTVSTVTSPGRWAVIMP